MTEWQAHEKNMLITKSRLRIKVIEAKTNATIVELQSEMDARLKEIKANLDAELKSVVAEDKRDAIIRQATLDRENIEFANARELLRMKTKQVAAEKRWEVKIEAEKSKVDMARECAK